MELTDEYRETFRNFYKYKCNKLQNQDNCSRLTSRGNGKTKITMTQFVLSLDIPYEEKFEWMKLIWGNNITDNEN